MANKSPLQRAKLYDLEERHVDVLLTVTVWLNSFTFVSHGTKKRIGTHHEPPLRELGRLLFDWSKDHEEAHEWLVEHQYFKSLDRDESPYCAGRLCHWLPTQRGMDVIEHVFSYYDDVWPSWVKEHHTGPPLFRDGPELMTHRKGVEVAHDSLSKMPWVNGIDRYPMRVDDVVADLHVGLDIVGEPIARVEVLTNHNKRETWVNKFNHWSDPADGWTLWLFENRETMVYFWNTLQGHGEESEQLIWLNNGLFGRRPQNWAAWKVNDRLQRSRNTAGCDYYSKDAVWTIPSLLEADAVDVHEWAKQYDIL